MYIPLIPLLSAIYADFKCPKASGEFYALTTANNTGWFNFPFTNYQIIWFLIFYRMASYQLLLVANLYMSMVESLPVYNI